MNQQCLQNTHPHLHKQDEHNDDDLQSLYHNAVHCLLLCDRQIKALQKDLSAKDEDLNKKDEHIASLENKIVDMSFELASSMAREDESQHQLSKQKRVMTTMSDSTKRREDESADKASKKGRSQSNDRRNSNRHDNHAVSRSWSAVSKDNIHHLDRSSRSEEVAPSSRDTTAPKEAAISTTTQRQQQRGGFKLPPLNMVSWSSNDADNDNISTMDGTDGVSVGNHQEQQSTMAKQTTTIVKEAENLMSRYRIMRDKYGLQEVEEHQSNDIIWEAI